MKFGFRKPSLSGKIGARTSLSRVVRHSLGVKAPKGMGVFTNPKKAVYNKVYNKTSKGCLVILAPLGAGIMLALLMLLLVINGNAQSTLPNNQFAEKIIKPTLSDAELKREASIRSASILMAPEGTSTQLISRDGEFYKVMVDSTLGYLHYVFIDGDYQTFSSRSYPLATAERSVNNSTAGAPPETAQKRLSLDYSTPSTMYSTPTTGASVHTGPRGGRYYYNSNGNKTYIRKK